MTSTHVLAPTTLAEPHARTSGRLVLKRRLPAAVVGLLGASVLGYGVIQPWVSTFAGLVTQSGWGTRNGNLLFAGAVAAAVFAVVSAVWSSPAVRWLLALTGLVTVAFAGYLLIQLYVVTQTGDSMIFLAKGPGLYLATAGAAIVFSTIFLPMPASATPDSDSVSGSDGLEGEPTVATSSRLLTALESPLRYPAALLAVIAGLAHVPVTPEHLNEAPYIGMLFIVLTVTCVVLAAALLVWDSPAVWAAVGGACLLAVVAFLLSRTVGLPLITDDIGNWLETLGVVSVLTEAGVVIVSVFALLRWRRSTHA